MTQTALLSYPNPQVTEFGNEDTAAQMADFVAAWEEILYGIVAGREW